MSDPLFNEPELPHEKSKAERDADALHYGRKRIKELEQKVRRQQSYIDALDSQLRETRARQDERRRTFREVVNEEVKVGIEAAQQDLSAAIVRRNDAERAARDGGDRLARTRLRVMTHYQAEHGMSLPDASAAATELTGENE